jgi:short subunit dehydrogenase
MRKAVIIGVGPDRGLGAQLCKRFAKEGLHVVAAGRTSASLDAVVADIERSGGEASSFAADATSEAASPRSSSMPAPRWISRSTTRATTRPVASSRWRRTTSRRAGGSAYGGFLFGREAPRRMVPRKRCTIRFTGPSAFGQGGLRTFAQAMAKEYGPEGIHVGHVVVDGAVNGDKIRRRFPDADSCRDRMLDIEGIVEC